MATAPGYLAAHGMSGCLTELARHNCISFRLMDSGAT